MIAAVFGGEFSDGLLNKATGLGDAALAEALEHLGRAQLVVPSGAVRGAHMFRHALIQDVAYQALLNRTRRQHHRRIGEILLADHREIGRAPSELQSLMRISYAVFCLTKKKKPTTYKYKH